MLTGRVEDLTRGKGYRLTAAGVSDELRDQLTARASSVATSNGFLDFQFPDRGQVNSDIDLLRAGNCAFESIVPTTNTLEEVFVKAVDGATEERPSTEVA